MNTLSVIEGHESFPFLNANYDQNDYALINLYWYEYFLKKLDDKKNWEYLDCNYYNFDEFQEQSLDVLNIINKNSLKAIIINPIDNYLSKFMKEFFTVSIGTEKKIINNEELKYEVLDIYADLRNTKTQDYINYFLDLFIVKKISLSEMESVIEEFENTHSLTNE